MNNYEAVTLQDINLDNSKLINAMESRIAEKCEKLDVRCCLFVNDSDYIRYELTDRLTGHKMSVYTNKQELEELKELGKITTLYNKLIKSLKLLVNARYGSRNLHTL